MKFKDLLIETSSEIEIQLYDMLIKMTKKFVEEKIKKYTDLGEAGKEYYDTLEDKMYKLGFNHYSGTTRPNSPESEAVKKIIDGFEKEYGLAPKDAISWWHNRNKIKDIVEKDNNTVIKSTVKKILDKINPNEVIEKITIQPNNKGMYDAFIILNNGHINIETIPAWGNVQRFHYRTLIKRK